jgi:hypothetical protein
MGKLSASAEAVLFFLERVIALPADLRRYYSWPRVKVGEVYEDCSYHPVMCTESVRHAWFMDHDLAGISLLDGSGPRSCSVRHCGVRLMSPEEVALRIENRGRWLTLEQQWRSTRDEDALQQMHLLLEEEYQAVHGAPQK